MKKEREKKRQDYFIDRLTEQLRQLQEKSAMYESQLSNQKKETTAATETMQDATMEMEAITFEKKQLLQQWKSSLIGLQRRDEYIQNIDKEIQKQKDNLISIDNEISGFKQSLRKQQEHQESLTMLLTKLENEIEYLKKQTRNNNEQQEKIKESYTMYAKTLSQTQSELDQVNADKGAIQQDISLLDKASLKLTTEIQKIEKEIMENLQNQISITKGAESAKKDGKKLKALVHEKETQIAQIQNDIALLKSESMSVNSKIDILKAKFSELDRELREKDKTIETYEAEIRKNEDLLSKKQSEVDLLNKKYDQLTSHTNVRSKIWI